MKSIGNTIVLILAVLLSGACRAQAAMQVKPDIEQATEVSTTTPTCSACAQVGEAAQSQQERQDARMEIDQWLYLLDVDLNPQLVETVAGSSYDLVVIDFISSERGNEDYPIETVIERWHGVQHTKLVLAYINIGQAEDYRSYWQPDWMIGRPDWILGSDAEGWEGNYPVAYWRDEWQQIWLSEGGLLQQVDQAGFDGIYLDNLEIYADDAIIEKASLEGVDAAFEMFNWVYRICDEMRSLRSSSMVVAQNALPLLGYEKLLWCLDGVSQEHVWFDGGSENIPEGDCPLPAAPADIDSQPYREFLSTTCLKYYQDEPDGTLHTSSQEYIEGLVAAREKGLLVLTVDYALESNNIEEIFRRSSSLGFIPFTGSRRLDRYIPPRP